MIAPIQTTWNNYHFRSRTEAKWAVTLTTLGIPFEYEEKAYSIPGVGGYVPDFYLPTMRVGEYHSGGCFLEIKPADYIKERQSPTMELSSLTREPVVTFYGFPDRGESGINEFFDRHTIENAYVPGPSGNGLYCDNLYLLGVCKQCGSIEIQYMGKSERHACDCSTGDKGSAYDDESLLLAYDTARSYQF